MTSDFVKLEQKQFFRSSYWQKSIALNILLGFVALYFIVVFIALGFSLYPIIFKYFPDQDPLVVASSFLFYWFLADLVMRFFFQKLPLMQVKPLLTLPIKKSKVIHYVLRKSLFSFFNFLPLFAIIPFGIVTVMEGGYDSGKMFTWIVFVVLATLIVNFLNFIIEIKSSESDLSFLPLLVIASILFGLNYFELVQFDTFLAQGVISIVEKPVYLIVPFLVLVGLYFLDFQNLKKQLYLDRSVRTKTMTINSSDLSWTQKFGSSAPFLKLDLRLIWRNKRSRSTVFILVIGLLYGLFFYPNKMYQEWDAMFVFVGVFITGIFMINFGQFIPAWDSSYYKLLMSQNIRYKDYLNSKYTLMMLSALILFILSIPYVYFGWKIILIHFAAMVYNIGVNSHVLLYAGSFNRKKINLDQRAAFNYQGTGAVQWLVGIPLLLLPVLFFYLPYKFINFESGLTFLIILGLLGILFHTKLMRFITAKYQEVKYPMIEAFNQDN
ncbi:DUF5687 family protein [Namhaeicola litoreus]|uniref:DUF5687 family protein n=1 Tax=Namhaeicola litoreus TaxID=1052145 RepID=A0ABW3XWQ1_9FLAO